MKIGLVCPYNIFKGGGVQECVRALQAGLNARGHDAYIITPLPKPKNENREELPKVLFLGASTDVKSFHTTAQVSISVSPEAVEKLLDEHNFDILHFHEPWVPMISLQLLNRSKSLNVATFHAKLPGTMLTKTIEKVITPYTKSALKNLDVLTAVSSAAAEYVRQLTNQEVKIVPNGIDLKKYSPGLSAKSDKPVILYVGRLEKRKGVKKLLQAFALLSQDMPEAQLKIAGDGPDKIKLEAYAKELRLNNVEFMGYVSEQHKLELMSNARVFCSPALYGESFGIVLLEAMAMGLPVVAGDNPGYASVMQGRGAMSLVNPKDSSEFARKLKLLLTDIDIADLWKNWAKEYVQQFDYEKVIDAYEKIYNDSLSKK